MIFVSVNHSYTCFAALVLDSSVRFSTFDLTKIFSTCKTHNFIKDFKSSGKRLGQVTVAEAWLNTLVTIEVITWFFVGEVIGRRHLVGYKV